MTALHTFGSLGIPISTSGAATLLVRAAEVLGECFAGVVQCAGAQAWFDTARYCQQRDHVAIFKSCLC